MIRLKLEEDGRLPLPAGIASSLAAQELRLASRSQRHLLFSTGAGEGQVALAGRLGELLVAELLSFLNMFRKSGVLHFNLAGGAKELVIEAGEIVSASSTFPEEELGEFLLAMRKIDRDTLIKLRQGATGDEALLRRQLLASGLVSPRDLWDATHAQIEAIVFHLIPLTEGDFLFIHQSGRQNENQYLTLSTQNMIMEGLRRSDERRRFMQVLGSLDAVPQLVGGMAVELAPVEERLLTLVGAGRLAIRDLIGRSGLSEFDGLRHLFALVDRGLLRIDEAYGAIPAELSEILGVYNGVLAALYQKIEEHNPDFGVEMRRFLRDLPQPFGPVLRNVAIAANGTIDGVRIAINLAGYPPEEQRTLLAATLNEVVFMACMAACRDLGEAASSRLVHQAQEISIRMQQLIERKK